MKLTRATKRRIEAVALPTSVLVVVLVLWEVASRQGWINDLFFPPPSRIFTSARENITTGDFWTDVRVSGSEFAVGYLAAIGMAIPFGLATGWFRSLNYLTEPVMAGVNATPRLALLPLVVLWVGLGFWSKAVIVFLGVFFPVAINTMSGVRAVDRGLLNVATSFGASGLRRITSVVLPSVVPFTLAGMRIGIGRAVSGVVVAEFFTSQQGLGNFVFRSGQRLETADLLFGAFFITIIALVAFKGVSVIENRFKAWRPQVGT